MNQRTERIGGEIRAILGELLARGDIKDPRVRDAGLVTITNVRVTGDLREARVGFTSYGAAPAALARIRDGLESARPYLQREIGRHLRTRVTPALHFEIDTALEEGFRVNEILKEIAKAPPAEAAGASEDGDGDGDEHEPDDEDGGGAGGGRHR